jgi:hypothetical protein
MRLKSYSMILRFIYYYPNYFQYSMSKLEEYTIQEEIANGRTARVFKAISNVDKRFVASTSRDQYS